MKRSRLLAAVGALTALLAAPIIAYGAGLWPGLPEGNGAAYCGGTVTAGVPGTATTCVSPVPAGPVLTGNEMVPMDTAQPGVTSSSPQPTIIVPSATLAGMTYATPRNFLGNSSLLGTQVNGTNIVTGATTSSPTTAALGADRWVIDTNVTSGAGRSQIVTATPSPPAGFTQTMKLYRTSGALTQPVCAWQAIPTPQSTQLAGQTVTFMLDNVAALAGLAADNGGQFNMVVITGTGTDQGFNGAWTASPAITPAWTGIATAVNTLQTGLTTTFARYYTTALIPATATEIGVGVCFTPTASGAGTTDGIAWVGAQLERSSVPSLYEVRPRQAEIADNSQFLYVVTEGAGPTVRGMCTELTTNATALCYINYPVPMYKVPAVTTATGFATPTTTADTALTACSTFALSADGGATNVQSTTGTAVKCTQTSATFAVGNATALYDNGGTGVIIAWTGL